MNMGPDWKDLINHLKIFTIWTVSGLIDSSFLALWVWVTWLVNEIVISRFFLSGLDRWVLSTFQIFFAISTLAPVAIYILNDLAIMVMQARRRVQHEKDKDNKNALAKSNRSTRR